MSIGDRIKEARTSRGLRAKWVARQVGVRAETLSRWEANAMKPSAANLIRLADLLGWSTEELVGMLREAEDGRAS